MVTHLVFKMCGIAGIISKDGNDVSGTIKQMMETIRHRGPDGCGLLMGKTIQRGFSLEDINFDEKASVAMGHTRLAIVGGESGQQPLQDCHKKLTVLSNGEIYNYRQLRKELESEHYFETETDSETVVHLLEDAYQGDLESAVCEVLPKLDGVFALAVSDGDEIVVARDMLGVKQLYIGENEYYIAFASERKALWEVGIENEERLLFGHVARFSKDGMVIKKALNPPVDEEVTTNEFEDAVNAYGQALVDAVRKRVSGLDRVGIIFSGGIDSVLIAKIASQFTDVVCYTAGVKGSEDIKYARIAAQKIGVDIKTRELDLKDVESYIPKTIEAIEDRLFGQVKVAIPIYASVEMCHEDGVKVMLTGQGADELWGGYPWYRTIVEKEGYDSVREYMKGDILNLYKETLEREDKITMANSVELRVPFLDPQVIRVAMQTDDKLKIRSVNDKLGKYIHRELPKIMGVPEELADRAKDAAQHGSGVHKAILDIAEKNGYEKETAEKVGYKSNKSIREKLGSSVRYGYKYSKKTLWKIPDHIQFYLDVVSLKKHLINESELNYAKKKLVAKN